MNKILSNEELQKKINYLKKIKKKNCTLSWGI